MVYFANAKVIKSFFLSLTKDLIYFQRKEVKNAPGTKKVIYIGILESIVPIAFIIFLTNALSLPWHHFILSYVLPLLFATTILGVFFDYLVHRPHKSTERFGDTNVIRIKNKLHQNQMEAEEERFGAGDAPDK